jgi:hypothetical protein
LLVGFDQSGTRKFHFVFVDDFSSQPIELVDGNDDAIEFLDGVSSEESGSVNAPNAIALLQDVLYFETWKDETGIRVPTLFRFSLSNATKVVEKVLSPLTEAAAATFVDDCYVYIPQRG